MGEEGVEDQEDMAPEARESSISSDPQQSAPMKVARDHGDLVTKERTNHNATHINFRSWCPICVKAKGRKEAYGSRKREELQSHHFIRLC